MHSIQATLISTQNRLSLNTIYSILQATLLSTQNKLSLNTIYSILQATLLSSSSMPPAPSKRSQVLYEFFFFSFQILCLAAFTFPSFKIKCIYQTYNLNSSYSLFVGCLTSQQHSSVSQGWTSSDKFMCCHTETELQIKLLTSPSHSILTPGQPVTLLTL